MRRISVSVIGINIESYENGKLECMSMVINGNVHGDAQWFYENGKLERMCTYVNDKLHGDGYWFYENGNIRYKYTYSNGKLHSDENGKPGGKSTYVNGKRQN